VRQYAKEYSDTFREAGFSIPAEPVLLNASQYANIVDDIINEEDSDEETDSENEDN
jgi:hypothetical protein